MEHAANSSASVKAAVQATGVAFLVVDVIKSMVSLNDDQAEAFSNKLLYELYSGENVQFWASLRFSWAKDYHLRNTAYVKSLQAPVLPHLYKSESSTSQIPTRPSLNPPLKSVGTQYATGVLGCIADIAR